MTIMNDTLLRITAGPVVDYAKMGVVSGQFTLAQVSGFELSSLLQYIVPIASAVGILLVGWFVAIIASGLVKGLLKKTSFDESLAKWMGSQVDSGSFALDKWVALAVFWGIMIFALMGALNALNLNTVSGPIQGFVDQILGYAPKILAAGALLGVAWVLATILKTITTRGVDSMGLTKSLAEWTGESPSDAPLKSETLGDILYWGVFIAFLPMILGTLDLAILGPVNSMVNDLLSAIPKIVKAILIGTIGYFVAKLVRKISSSFLKALGSDTLGANLGLAESGLSLSELAGNLLFGFILLTSVVTALEALEMQAISGPATSMLKQILDKLPAVFTAVAILTGSFFLGRFVAQLVAQLLRGIGFDRVPGVLGLPQTAGAQQASDIAGTIVLVGIMLTAVVGALDALQMPQLSAIATSILAIAGQVLVGVLVFAVGLYISNLAVQLIKQSGLKQANMLANTARIVILAFVGAMALQRMGIAPDIVNLAFGLLLGSASVALALAFGLGGRDVAGEQLREWLDDFKK